MTDLDKLLETVQDRESFLAFAKALAADRKESVKIEKQNPSNPYETDARGWENTTIEQYLESAVAWTEDWLERDEELPKEPTWKSFARFLYAGKYYE